MATADPLDPIRLNNFAATYHSPCEDAALQSRGEFLEKFPMNRLKDLTLTNYVIGHQSPTFCAYVEVKTMAWARIQGATALKFGIYYGRTKSDAQQRYRFTKKFGKTETEAFEAVKLSLLDLIDLGGKPMINFRKIDDNPLSQMFKAKVLSLYFPKRFLNVCSAEHIETLASKLGISKRSYTSEYQYQLAEVKKQSDVAKDWSNPMFMNFLYSNYFRRKLPRNIVGQPLSKSKRKVNFEDVQALRDAIGKAAEEFALAKEHERLKGAELGHLIDTIEDCRDRPGYGYDFHSFTSPLIERYIEVKSIGKTDGGYRFFLSDNENTVSRSATHSAKYFFYLVRFDSNGKPSELTVVRADELYKLAELTPASYVVRFDIN